MTPDNRFIEDLTPTSNRVEEALVVDNPDAEQWDAACDVLVVGVGMAGVCAALRASEEKNFDVIAIDRAAGGGASQMSGGIVYMGGGTPVQKKCGVEDTPENMADYLANEVGTIVREDTVLRFARASTNFQEWLEKYGARFDGPATEDKTSYPNDASLYYSGNELTPAGRALAKPAQRGHRAQPSKGGAPKDLSGQYLLPPLIESLKKQPNVNYMSQTRAVRLIVDRSGTVVGLEAMRIDSGFAAWRHAKAMALTSNLILSTIGVAAKLFNHIIKIEQEKSRRIRIRVRKGVVLSAGGFTYNRSMMAKTAPEYMGSFPLGTIGDDGSGIKLGMSVGGTTDSLHRISAWKFLYPPASFVKSCSVDSEGQRLVGEEYYGARTGDAVFVKGKGKGWLITDQPIWDNVVSEIDAMKKMLFQKIQYKAVREQYTVSAPTLEELAEKLGIPAAAMRATVEEYNGYIERGEDDPMGKSEKYRYKIETGPFYATDIGENLKVMPIPALTMGGLVVDEDSGQVLDAEGAGVPGLYAAGRTAVGICSHHYVSGLSLADCVWSGLRAAETMRGNGGAKALAP